MPEAILEPSYWKKRLETSHELHHAIFRCSNEQWDKIAEKHKRILANVVLPESSVLDVGCGWGRLLTLLPDSWIGCYVGVDLSPDFIRMANDMFPANMFLCHDMLQPLNLAARFDFGVFISVRPMVKRNCGESTWMLMESNVRKLCDKLLYLEYDPEGEGYLE